MAEGTPPQDERYEEDREIQERLVLPLLIPATVFLFGVLVIYGLSRIYLELNEWHYKDVRMATPLAIGVALTILLVSAFMASRRTVARGLIPIVMVLAAAALTSGAIWAAVHPDPKAEVVAPTATPDGNATPPPAGSVQIDLIDPSFALTVDPATAPAGAVTFNVTNQGSILHNLRVIKTDDTPDALPVDSTTFTVDETAVDVVAQLSEFDPGETQQLEAQLQTGAYVLICNVPTHYDSGMHAAFAVE